MKLNYTKVFKGCIALIITVAGLYIGQALWQNYAVDLPLDKALNGIEGVEKVTWDNGDTINDIVDINVQLDNTANIKETYDEMTGRIEETLKDKKYELKIQDNRSSELEQIYYDIHYYIEKAIIDGDFPLLSSKTQEKAAAAGASARIYVDESNVYLQMSKDNFSLYAITARNSNKVGGSS